MYDKPQAGLHRRKTGRPRPSCLSRFSWTLFIATTSNSQVTVNQIIKKRINNVLSNIKMGRRPYCTRSLWSSKQFLLTTLSVIIFPFCPMHLSFCLKSVVGRGSPISGYESFRAISCPSSVDKAERWSIKIIGICFTSSHGSFAHYLLLAMLLF